MTDAVDHSPYCAEPVHRATMHQAAAWLEGATLVGLDAEWRPIGGSGRASLLQVATPTHVCLFDLMPLAEAGLVAASAISRTHSNDDSGSMDSKEAVAMDVDAGSLGDNSSRQATRLSKQDAAAYAAALDACLSQLFHNPACLKLGVELAGDLRKLSGSFPLAAFSHVVGALELRDLWVEYVRATNPNQLRGAATSQAACAPEGGGGGGGGPPGPATTSGMTYRQVAGAGLSRLAATVLGKPLDKSMQVGSHAP